MFFLDERKHYDLIYDAVGARSLETGVQTGLNLQSGMSCEDLGQIAMRVGKLDDQAATFFQHAGGDVNEMAPEALPLPAHHFGGQRQLRDPFAQIPGQTGDLKPRPIAHKLRHRHAPARNPGAELLDHVFLIAALVGQIDDLAGRVGARQVGQYKTIPEGLEQRPLAVLLLDADAPHDHPTGTLQPRGLIGQLGKPLPDGAQVAKAPLRDLVLAPVWGTPLTRRCAAWAASLHARDKRLPGTLGQRRRQRRTVGIHAPADGKVRPRIDCRLQHVGPIEVGVPAHQRVAEMALYPRQYLAQRPGARLRRARVARLVDHPQTLAAAAQRYYQRLVGPAPVVAEVRPFLVLAVKRFDVAVEVDQRQLVPEALAPHAARQLGPRLLLDLIDHGRELLDLRGSLETAQKIARRGRVGYPARPHHAAHRLASLQRPLVLQAGAVDIQCVG